MIKIALVGDILITRRLPSNGYNGLLATMRYLRENDISLAGTGENLGDATAPNYLEQFR
jgi:hypothetical protein